VVATIFISRNILRFRGLDNAEKVTRGFLSRPVADRDKSECGCCYTEAQSRIFSGYNTQLLREARTLITKASWFAWKFSLGDYGLVYLTQQKCGQLFHPLSVILLFSNSKYLLLFYSQASQLSDTEVNKF